ncbi:MAG: hypothetical protein MI862_18800 [Desulfobacterales bacterium]|nr:hypothetical protein [Desulfobacterales bacterium]
MKEDFRNRKRELRQDYTKKINNAKTIEEKVKIHEQENEIIELVIKNEKQAEINLEEDIRQDRLKRSKEQQEKEKYLEIVKSEESASANNRSENKLFQKYKEFRERQKQHKRDRDRDR